MAAARSYVFFWKPSEPLGYLGNWYPAAFEANGVLYPTSEHYMMYAKAMLMGDESVAAQILASPDPGVVKKLGQTVSPWNEALWIENRNRIMFEACLAKFSAHADLRASLLATGNAVLVEASPFDRIWGIGMGASHRDAENPAKWKGMNLLGEALMKVRDRLAAA